MTTNRTQTGWGALAVGLLIVAALALAACGGGGDDTDGTAGGAGVDTAAASDGGAGADRAEQAIAKYQKVPKFTLEAPTIDAKEAAGKKVFAIPILSANEFNATVDALMGDISDRLGIDFVEYENQGTPTEWAKGIEQAIAEQADAIIMMGGGDPSLVLPQIKRAKAAGIPTIVSHYYQYGQVPPKVEDELGALVYVAFNEAAKLMLDYAYVQEGDGLNPLIVTAEEAVPSAGMVESIETELDQLCPDCDSTVINVPVADWGSKMQGEVQSALAKDPGINYVLPIYDPMVIGAQAGVNAAGRSADVSIASYATTPAVLKLIQEGTTVKMDVGESVEWVAYATMDQALRLLTGNPPVPGGDNNEKLGLRVFYETNIDETGTPPSAKKGFGDEFVAGYEELWSLR